MSRIILFSFFFYFLFSCSSSEDMDTCELIYVGSKEFQLDDNSYYYSKCISSFIDKDTGKEYFSFENTAKGQNEILLYDMATSKLVKRIDIKGEGANTSICAVMDISKNTLKKMPLSYPILFKRKSLITSTIDVGYSCDFDGENFIYSFMKSDSLIVTSDHVSAKRFEAKSKYVNNIKPIPNPGNDILSVQRALCKQGMYWHFVYDKYRDVYYRFVFFPCEIGPNDNPLDLDSIRQEFSIIIMNKSFEVIGETRFPKNKYLPKMFFIGKDGLYLSENNPYNEKFDENRLIFSSFTLRYH